MGGVAVADRDHGGGQDEGCHGKNKIATQAKRRSQDHGFDISISYHMVFK